MPKANDGYEYLGPGLHRIGPEPFAFVFNPAVGQKVTFVGLDGRAITGIVTDFTEDDETGEIRLVTA